MSYESVPWNILDIFFRDNPSFLVEHHIESYNDFFENGLPRLLKEKNPIHFFKNQEKMSVDKQTRYVGYNLPDGTPKSLTFDEMKNDMVQEN